MNTPKYLDRADRVKYVAYYENSVTLQDLSNVEFYMKKEELVELHHKMSSLMDSLLGIDNVQTRALMEQMFKRGYLAAHIYYEKQND